MNDKDCFGEFPFDNPCDRAICMSDCEDYTQCKIKTMEKGTMNNPAL